MTHPDTWLPIDSAPKDGTRIVVFYNTYPVFVGAKETTGSHFTPMVAMWSTWDGAFRVVGTGDILDGLKGHKPTEWFPLPIEKGF